MKLQPLKHPVGFGSWKGLLERACRVGREVVEHHPDHWGAGIVNIDQIPQAVCKVLVGAPVGNLHSPPGPVGVQKNEKVDGSITAIFTVIALELSRLGRDGLAYFADKLGWTFIEAHYRPLWIRNFGIKVKHIFQAGDVFAIHLWNAPPVFTPWLQIVFRQSSANRLAR
jgi:hypothetical protein